MPKAQGQRAKTTHGRNRFRWACGILSWAFLAGCSSYQLQGVALNGPAAGVLVVNEDDPRLAQPGLTDVTVQIIIDPAELRPKPQGMTFSDTTGHFALPIGETGAGFLQYQALVIARHPGYKASWQTIPLPGANKRLIIMMTPGQDTYRGPQDILRDTMKMGEMLQGQ